MVRKFSKKARRYMLGYSHQRLLNKKDDDGGEWNKFRNKKVHQLYKSHRDACTFDSKFIKEVMLESTDYSQNDMI